MMNLKPSTGAAFAAYSINLEPGAGRARFISALLSANLSAGWNCALMTPLSPERFLARCDGRRATLFRNAIEQKKLLIFTMLGDYRKNIFRFGPDAFVRELAGFGLPEETLLVIDQAESIFSLHHQDIALEQLRVYQEWLQRARTTALLLFSPAVERSTQAGACQAVVDNTSGSARLMYDHGTQDLWVDFWQSAEGENARRKIVLDAGGRKKPHGDTPPSANTAEDLIRNIQAVSR